MYFKSTVNTVSPLKICRKQKRIIMNKQYPHKTIFCHFRFEFAVYTKIVVMLLDFCQVKHSHFDLHGLDQLILFY